MIVDFNAADRPYAIKAASLYIKGLDAAGAACEKVHCPTLQVDAVRATAEEARGWLYGNLEDMEPGEERELDVPAHLAHSLRTAVSVYLAQLDKLTDKSDDMLVPTDGANAIVQRLQTLADRLAGQLSLVPVGA